ncbi:MAG TPA: M15 family metallopeptidase [Candidatus Nitrosotenuis sp.]|nr:M15 family metallopeptidase [Candidatus Nitrosotenuis sp.]
MNLGKRTAHTTSWKALLLIGVFTIGIAVYIVLSLQSSSASYSSIQKELEKPIYRGSVSKVIFPGSEDELNIPNWQIFESGNIWSFVSGKYPLQNDFTPNDLIATELPQGDAGTDMKYSERLTPSLSAMFKEADAQGHPLMISSAYRSIVDQQKLYEDFVSTQGQAAADTYVANPGTSEHHTGLAVDLSDYSESCAADSDRCSIGIATSQWLAENSYKYGYIVRYPEGKQPITGIAHEPWHYRYVGVPLAKMIYSSDLTLDETLRQMRPAFAQN